jgi:DNA-binding LytR/AlgR family response regulator
VKTPPIILDADINEVTNNYDNISFIEGREGYTRLHTKDEDVMEFPHCLKYFESKLPSGIFLRTCNSNIVNTGDVKTHFPQSGKTIAVMNSLNQVPVAPEKTELLKAMMLKNKPK